MSEAAAYRLHLLVSDPWVGAAYNGMELRPAAAHLARLAKGGVAHLLVRPTWHSPDVLQETLDDVRAINQAAPNLKLTFAAATADDDVMFRRAGLSSIWCSHNAMLDERLYTPDPAAEARFDAVHIGRITPFKRHELASRVPRLAVITGSWEVDDASVASVISGFDDLRYVNYAPGAGVTELSQLQVRQVLNASRCGLALSAKEGAMYASAEYLLCGLPVVTTPSVGGRDVFFHPDYVVTADPDADAVAAGIADLLARDLDPQVVRQRTLDLFMPHRARLLMWLSGIVQQNLFPLAGETLWLRSYTNKLETWRPPYQEG